MSRVPLSFPQSWRGKAATQYAYLLNSLRTEYYLMWHNLKQCDITRNIPKWWGNPIPKIFLHVISGMTQNRKWGQMEPVFAATDQKVLVRGCSRTQGLWKPFRSHQWCKLWIQRKAYLHISGRKRTHRFIGTFFSKNTQTPDRPNG